MHFVLASEKKYGRNYVAHLLYNSDINTHVYVCLFMYANIKHTFCVNTYTNFIDIDIIIVCKTKSQEHRTMIL